MGAITEFEDIDIVHLEVIAILRIKLRTASYTLASDGSPPEAP